jgi:hypothetical protein
VDDRPVEPVAVEVEGLDLGALAVDRDREWSGVLSRSKVDVRAAAELGEPGLPSKGPSAAEAAAGAPSAAVAAR